MKKTMLAVFALFLALMIAIPASAADSLPMTLEKPAEFEGAPTYECEEYDGGEAPLVGSQDGGWNYAYLKKTVDNPHVIISFDVAEAGTYDFLIELMAFSTAIPRTGLVQIDNGDKLYISSTHGDRHLITEYYTGLSAELTAGTHTFTIYLADDFDDSTVKSLFFDRFSFVKRAEVAAPETEAPAPETEAPTSEAVTAPTPAPQTADVLLTGGILLAASAVTALISKKRK